MTKETSRSEPGNSTAVQPAGSGKFVQTEPNGVAKPLPRVGPKGSGAVHGGEAAKPGQLPHDEDVGPKD